MKRFIPNRVGLLATVGIGLLIVPFIGLLIRTPWDTRPQGPLAATQRSSKSALSRAGARTVDLQVDAGTAGLWPA